MRVLRFILGILALFVAVFCFWNPIGMEAAFVYIGSIFIGVVGIISLIDGIVNRKKRKLAGAQVAVGGLGIAGSIVAIIFMLFTITIPGFTGSMMYIFALIFVLSLIVEGIVAVVRAFARPDYGIGFKILIGILGFLIIAAAAVSLFWLPIIAVDFFGILTGIGIAVSGVSLIASAFAREQ